MEHEKIEGMAKKIWKIVKVALLMLRKGICKRKILLDLNIMIKRGKLAGKSIRNIILLHHHHHHHNHHHRRQVSTVDHQCAAVDPDSNSDDDISCTTSPLHENNHNNADQHQATKLSLSNIRNEQAAVELSLSNICNGEQEVIINSSPSRVLLEKMVMTSSCSDVVASPRLRVGRGPVTRELRVTDSPFPLQNDPEETRRVNQAAEDFIKRFYSQLKRQQD